MNGWLKKIRPIYTKRLRPASREVYRVTGVKKVLSLEKKSVVWRKLHRPIASFTTRDSPSDWYRLAVSLEVSGVVLKAVADLDSIAFTSRMVYDFNTALKQHPEYKEYGKLRLYSRDLDNRLKQYWRENEVALFYPISSTVVAAVGRG